MWCRQEGRSISKPSSQKFADFLLFLRRQCNMSVSTIKGYKAMLNSVFSIKGFDLSQDIVLKNLMKAFEIEVPRRTIRTVNWNLDVVLKALTMAPFEPLRTTLVCNLTKKTLFLLALASAKRVSEIQALSSRVTFQNGDMLVAYLPEFIAKTETLANPVSREFRVRNLTRAVAKDDEE